MDRHPVPATPPPVPRREEIARAWADEATTSTYIPRDLAEIEELLLGLVDRMLAALSGKERPDEVGLQVGARLVEEGFLDPAALRATIDTLSAGLLDDVEPTPDTELTRRAGVLLSSLAVGYTSGLRDYTLAQQEQVKQALFNAMVRTEHNLRAIENRFREVFTSSAVGIAITNIEGMCVESNPALSQILACPPGELAGRTLHDFFLADEDRPGAHGVAGDVWASYRRVLAGDAERVHEHRRLRKEDGETAWVFLAISLLHDGAGEPAYFVTMVQDISEMQLLQDRLSHQLLYDALTGLPNRQHFTTKLESTLGRVEPGATATLCLVDMDGFAAVNNGFGHEFGDRLLKTVGHRLEGIAEGSRALVARIGPDEFAVLFEDPPAAPPLDEVISRINTELAEAEFIDDRGVGLGATIGAARCGADEMTAVELFRGAHSALRKAKVTGRRQWAAFHPGDDYRCREDDALAVQLPAAWETGELTVAYQPVVRATDQQAVAARPVLVWQREDGETVSHGDCVALGERTGMSVQLGPAVLREVCARLPELRATLGAAPRPLLRLQLSRLQSADGDLVSAVQGAIQEAGVPADLLEIGLDTTAVLDHVYGDARENLDVLSDVGVNIALCGFQGGPRELDLLADTGVRAVTLAPDGAGTAGRDTASEVLREETERLVSAVVGGGRECSVLDVHTEAEALWWTNAGVTTLQGSVFGQPVAAGDLTTLTDPTRPVTPG